MAYTKLIPHASPGASVDENSRGTAFRLSIPSGKADKYRFAQLDDYAQIPRRRFPHRISPSTSLGTGLRLSLSARTSSDSIPGTWGFGLWNDPFGLSLGFGGNPFRLPALPNAAWFFGASKENYLSFSSNLDAGGTSTHPARPPVVNGFLAQTFRSPRLHPLLIPAGVVFPFSHRATRRLLGKVIGEDGVALRVDPTQWHRYGLDWREKRVTFTVGADRDPPLLVFESPVSPNQPLGLVIWIDNQYAAFTPDGKIGFGVLANPEPAWLEIREVEIREFETGD